MDSQRSDVAFVQSDIGIQTWIDGEFANIAIAQTKIRPRRYVKRFYW